MTEERPGEAWVPKVSESRQTGPGLRISEPFRGRKTNPFPGETS